MYTGQTGCALEHHLKECKRALTAGIFISSAIAEHAINTTHDIDYQSGSAVDSHLYLHPRSCLQSLAHQTPMTPHEQRTITTPSISAPVLTILLINPHFLFTGCHFYTCRFLKDDHCIVVETLVNTSSCWCIVSLRFMSIPSPLQINILLPLVCTVLLRTPQVCFIYSQKGSSRVYVYSHEH